ncbi:MAG: prepilin-type N-terminal cleavage/methylation domain-containing protein [Proteobacteria bacterium]|nr:prepilin-type N-terminal cleavage/methylation domain-containing protein [Pseudomonadota bacterium]
MSKNNKENFTNKGFTLIELLIVMVILGILVAIVFTNIDVARLTGRGGDTKRISDLRSVQDGIMRELAQNYIVLPLTGSISSTEANAQLVNGTGWVRFSTNPQQAPNPYKFSNLSVLPVDPKNNQSISYTVKGTTAGGTTGTRTVTATARYQICYSATGFEIRTALEQDVDKMANDGGTDETSYQIGTDLTACGTGRFGQ